MKKIIGKVMLRLLGWSWRNDVPVSQIEKSVMVCAPHTSNWDFVYAVFAFWSQELPIRVFIKESHVNAWYGGFVKWLGGIPVSREQSGDLVNYASRLLHEADRMVLIITPEGTRSHSPKWKKGFYYIALRAHVPIAVAIGNYKEKQAQIVNIVDPQEKSLDEVLDVFRATYKPEMAKYPEKFNTDIQ